MQLLVETYLDGGVEKLRRIRFDARRIEITDNIDQWHGADYRYFKVRGSDGNLYMVRYDEIRAAWELTMYGTGDFGSRDWKTVLRGRSDMVDPLSGSPKGSSEVSVRQAALNCAELPLARTEDPGWIIVGEGFTPEREHELESLFAIGNGYAGSRGSLAEGSALSAAATFVAGVFDSEAGTVPSLAPTADWNSSVRYNRRPAASARLRPEPGASSHTRHAARHPLEGVAAPGRSRSDHPAAGAAPSLFGRPPSPGSMCGDHARKLQRKGVH